MNRIMLNFLPFIIFVLILGFTGCGGGGNAGNPTPTVVSTLTPTHTATPNHTATPTLTATPTIQPTPSPTPDPYTTIISDGWETGGISWNYLTGAVLDTGNPHSGSHNLELPASSPESECEFHCYNGLIPSATKARVICWVKGTPTTGFICLTIACYDNTNNYLGCFNSWVCLSDTYTKVEIDGYTLFPGTASIDIQIYNVNSSGTIYVDDYSLGVK